MTVTLKVHVNGNYRATVKHSVTEDGKTTELTPVEVGPQETKDVSFRHGAVNTLEVTEEYLGEKRS